MNRETFEAWMTSEQWFHEDDFKWDESRNCYAEYGIHIAFKAYQAAIASMQSERDQLAAQLADVVSENAALKAAFDKPDAWLSWHSIPPTFYEPDRGGEYLQVHERAGEKNDDGSDSWPVYRKPETETPATDRFLAEQRAQGVEMFADRKSKELFSLHPDTHAIGSIAASMSAEVHELREFAAQLRNEVKV